MRPDYHLGIITNGSAADYPDSQTAAIKHVGLEYLVDSIWISDTVGVRKPSPRIFEVAMEAAEVEAGLTIYVGDSVSKDIVGAKHAGMKSVLMDPKACFDQNEAEAQPDYIIRELDEILGILTGIQEAS